MPLNGVKFPQELFELSSTQVRGIRGNTLARGLDTICEPRLRWGRDQGNKGQRNKISENRDSGRLFHFQNEALQVFGLGEIQDDGMIGGGAAAREQADAAVGVGGG